ncbi:MAG: inositol monophosphatase [Homoserinimonas sp.]|nr:inositol monophosphatase [Homoserinimonas sp.]
MESLEELGQIATRVATAAGDLILQRRHEGVRVAASKSSLEDVVTDADRESESLIRSMLSELRPNDGFLGEEGGSSTGTSGLTWVADPIDGTVNYLYGIPQFAVSLAVVEGEPNPATWRTLAGAVVNPSSSEVFSATSGTGAKLNGSQIAVVEPAGFSQSLIGIGFSYLSGVRAEQAEVLARLITRVRDIRRMGSSALDLCAVACGRLNGYFERELKPWDHAAAGLIAREAGAVVSGIGEEPPDSRIFIAAAPSIHDELRSLVLVD